DDLVAVLDGGDAPVGIHLEIGWIVVAAKRAGPVDAMERDAELDATPQNFLHVERGVAAPNLDHAVLVCILAFWVGGTAFHSLAPQGRGWGEGVRMLPYRTAGAPSSHLLPHGEKE